MKNVKHIKAAARLKVGKSYGDYKLYLILECLGQRLKKIHP